MGHFCPILHKEVGRLIAKGTKVKRLDARNYYDFETSGARMAGTNSKPSVDFAYRHNTDDSWDSICLRCYLTAASGVSPEALSEAEAEHRCNDEFPKRMPHRQ